MIASDIADYILWTLHHMRAFGGFRWTATQASDWQEPPQGWPSTRYEAKALKAGGCRHICISSGARIFNQIICESRIELKACNLCLNGYISAHKSAFTGKWDGLKTPAFFNGQMKFG